MAAALPELAIVRGQYYLSVELTKLLLGPDSDAHRNEHSHRIYNGNHGEHLAQLVLTVAGRIVHGVLLNREEQEDS